MCKANSGHDHAGSGGVSKANLAHDGSGDRDLAAKPESQSQNDHTNGGREGWEILRLMEKRLA